MDIKKIWNPFLPIWVMVVCMVIILINCFSVILDHFEMLPVFEKYFENEYDENIYFRMSKLGLLINPMTLFFWIAVFVIAIKRRMGAIAVFTTFIALLASVYYTYYYYSSYCLDSYYRIRSFLDLVTPIGPWVSVIYLFSMVVLACLTKTSVIARILLIVTLILANLNPLYYLFEYLGFNELPNVMIIIMFCIASILCLYFKSQRSDSSKD